VRLVRADVGCRDQLHEVLTEIRTSMPELRGIFHCAGVFEDRLVADQTWNLFERVFAAKVAGAWNLHQLTRQDPLDLFVLFSSAASLFGAPGMANYVAANEFLNVLAEYRTCRNLPGLSIQWGPWKATGMAEAVRDTGRSRWKALGLHELQPETALQAMDHLLAEGLAHAAVVHVDWKKLHAQSLRSTGWRLLDLIAEPVADSSVTDFRRRLQTAPSWERLDMLFGHVHSVVARIIGLGPEQSLDPRRGIFEMGLDSLGTMEVRNQLRSSLGCNLPPTFAFTSPNVEALVNHLASELIELETTPPSRSPPLPAREPAELVQAAATDTVETRIAKELEALEELLN